MAPVNPSSTNVLLSPAELSYLHSSLSLSPPIRPDGRTETQFRPLVAETDILPSANGSARICWVDGTEAVVGVKAEVEKTGGVSVSHLGTAGTGDEDVAMDEVAGGAGKMARGKNEWLEMSVEIPGFRDDDSLPTFLASMLTEGLLADGKLTDRLVINERWHWKVYIDILLLSPPLSYPLPLLSLTTHLALLSTRLPDLKSEGDEDPLFDDDWDASTFLYPPFQAKSPKANTRADKPPITLLVIAVAGNIIFDPSKEELAVAEAVLAVTVTESQASNGQPLELRLLSIRTIDPPSRHTPPGVPNSLNSATGGNAPASTVETMALREGMSEAESGGVWRPPRGGMKRALVSRVVKMALEEGGVAREVLEALGGVEVG